MGAVIQVRNDGSLDQDDSSRGGEKSDSGYSLYLGIADRPDVGVEVERGWGQYQELRFEHYMFEISNRHPSGDAKWSVGYIYHSEVQ